MHQTETQVDVSADRVRYFHMGDTEPFCVPGTQVDVDIPFTGEERLLHYRTNPHFPLPVRAEVMQASIRISILLPHDVERERFKEEYERQLQRLRKCFAWSHDQVMAYNQRLPHLIQKAIADRRERLRKHAGIADLLNIPLAARVGAPSIAPVKITVRRPTALPVPPKTGLAREPGIEDESYERILHFIRHQGRTFERTPSTFAVHGEEDLRDIVLAQLNGGFQGEATGEVFRKNGKTDICIEQDDRAAFVGECKLWNGAASLTKALDQLLGYLTWRDSKASLLIFNSKVKNFSKSLETVPKAVGRHPLYLRGLPCEEQGEWRVQMRSEEDEGRRVTVHVFIFNLYHEPALGASRS